MDDEVAGIVPCYNASATIAATLASVIGQSGVGEIVAIVRGWGVELLAGGPSGRTEPDPTPIWLGELYPPIETRFSSRKAQQVLGWKPRIGLAQAQGRTVDWMIGAGLLPDEASEGHTAKANAIMEAGR